MNILFLTIEDVDGSRGSSIHIREKVAAFRKRGHRVFLLGGSRSDFEFGEFKSIGSCRNEDGSVSYFRLGVVFSRLGCGVLRNAKDIDVIYSMGPVATLAAVLTKPLHHIGAVSEVTSLENEEAKMKGNALAYRAFSLLQRIGARFSDRITVITDRVKDYYVANYNVPEGRIKVLGVTTDPEKFLPIRDRSALKSLRDRLRLPHEAFVALFIGNLAPWQDFELLVKSAAIVCEKKPDARFLIVGDGAQREWLERIVRQHSLDDQILLLGAVAHREVGLYISLADVCLALCKELVSGYSPMKLFEYLACGKPVVATRVSGYEIVERAGAGKLIDNRDERAFAEAVVSFAESEELRERCGANALTYAREHFGWDKVVTEIEALMREMGISH